MPAPQDPFSAAREESTLPSGRRFGPFEIEGLIRRGGMGIVYRARQPRLGRPVALKVLPPELAQDEQFRERFMREAQSAASLRHPNIVTVYDADEADGLLYIAMQCIDGPDLSQVLHKEGALDPQRTLGIVRQVAEALDAAHVRGLIHRDVKPANVLMGEDRCYLTDFGLAKAVSETTRFTGKGQFLGTPDYVAPEQIRGEPLDARTDVYGLGCLVYRCLAGSVPFQHETEIAVIHAHLYSEPPPLSSHRPDLPPGLDDVIRRALAKSKTQRYPTCAALATAMGQALAGERVEPAPANGIPPGNERPTSVLGGSSVGPPAPPSSSNGSSAPRRRYTWLALAAVVAGFGIAALIALSGGNQPLPQPPATTVASHHRHKSPKRSHRRARGHAHRSVVVTPNGRTVTRTQPAPTSSTHRRRAKSSPHTTVTPKKQTTTTTTPTTTTTTQTTTTPSTTQTQTQTTTTSVSTTTTPRGPSR